MMFKTNTRVPRWVALLLVLVVPAAAADAARAPAEPPAVAYEPVSTGTRELVSGELVIRVLVERANLGGAEVELGEIVFPPGYRSSGHRHGSVEIFYVLRGTLVHEVNGVAHELTPGMVGVVRPPDTVTHRVAGDGPVTALVIWAPGGEAERLARVFPEQRPLR